MIIGIRGWLLGPRGIFGEEYAICTHKSKENLYGKLFRNVDLGQITVGNLQNVSKDDADKTHGSLRVLFNVRLPACCPLIGVRLG